MKKEKILLGLLPFWSPLIPPLGSASLKAFLTDHGYNVKTFDANMDAGLRQTYVNYFDVLRKYIPRNKRGNFYSIGHDLLRNQMMAHVNQREENQYRELIKILIHKTFYVDASNELVNELIGLLDEFFLNLEEYFHQLMEAEKPTMLGLSVYNGTLPTSLYFFRLARMYYPDVTTIMGGGVFADHLAPGSPNLAYFLERTEGVIDKIIIGEGELLFLKLLQGELPDEKRVYTLSDVNHQIIDLTTVPIPDFSDFDLQIYPNLAVYTSRSCPFQCSFCSETIQWGRYRKKKIQQIVDELKALHQRHDTQLFLMCDSLLNPLVSDLAEAFKKEEMAFYWDACLRADKEVCDSDTVYHWRQGGLYRARLGLESGSQRVLDLMSKKITVDQIKSALLNLAQAGIKTSTLWVIGHPGETEEDFQLTLDVIEEMKDYIYEAEGTPFWYYLTGQSNSEEWFKQEKVLLYPEWAKEMLITQTWILDAEPTREETYDRLNRFAAHLERLGIPNLYTLHEIYKADERWHKLHTNAVPLVVQFKNSEQWITECRDVKKRSVLKQELHDEGDFGF